jgi:hypothetical protein
MSTQSQTQLQINRYFTAVEAIEKVDVIEKKDEDDSEPHFDISDNNNNFDQEIDRDQDIADKNI